MPPAPDGNGQNDDLTEDDFDDYEDFEEFDDELTDLEAEELEEELEVDPTFGCSFTFKLSIGSIDDDEEDEVEGSDKDHDNAPTFQRPDWYDISHVNPDIFQTIWIEPEVAQRLMDGAKASGITAEQAYGWLLLRAYGRARK